uniref:Ribsomal protein L14 n=2 Tax=Ulva TaxID=3118 RepID=A0A222AII2_ULVPE|nr:ribsomal protein L14 [Ulva pertusa]YP_010021439.1 ribsomal protein L14 [Ulva australis]ASO76178.1 ribsomal protein L14 [Ulva pertusa]ASO76220.1 ribsomal protein L14 [Ulva pertusa]QOL10280.1 ribsomal protein L14 [Ulva australis]
MIQTQTKISIKDNSDFLQGKCINFNKKKLKKAAKIGNCVKVSISNVKPTVFNSQEYKKGLKASIVNIKKNSLQDLLLVQVKAPTYRKDGSTIQFYSNCGVCVVFKKAGVKKQHQLGFKRVNTTVPFELKNKIHAHKFKAAHNVIKVAKNLL